MTRSFRTISPVDGSVIFERALDGADEVERVLARANTAFDTWRNVDLAERCTAVRRFVEPLAIGASAGTATVAMAFALTRYLSPETRLALSEGIARSFQSVTGLFTPVAESLPAPNLVAPGGPGLHGVIWGLGVVAVAALAVVALKSSRQLMCELRETPSA